MRSSAVASACLLYYLGDAIPVDALSNLNPELNDTNEYMQFSIQYKMCVYDKKSDEVSNSVRMRHENSGASKVVKKWLSTRVSEASDAQLSDYV